MSKIRKAVVAGLFYPADRIRLKDDIETLLAVSHPGILPKKVYGIVSPHAGYIYSGRTAAFGFNLLKGENIENVIIISPSHREYFPGVSVYDGDAYETPLGIVDINQKISEQLILNSKSIFKGINGHKHEHAIEVQIPFLQTVLDDFNIIPVVIGDQGKIFIDELSQRLYEIIDDKTIIVASSDLSHYYSRDEANKLDSVIEERINNFEFERLQKDLDIKNCEACGGGSIVALLKSGYLKNFSNSKVLNRSDSGDTTGNTDEVVGYLSAVVYN